MRIGIDLGGTKIEGIVLDAGGEVRARRRIPSPRGDYGDTLSAICGIVDHLETECGATCSIGIGMPGAISPASGLVKNANSTWLNGRPFGPDLEDRLGREVRLANDADCFALSEAKDGAGAGCRTVFGVIIGTGTGGGIVHDGRLLSGPNAIAGEWGHNPLPWPHEDERPGPVCYCGKQGCIETWTSGPGLAAAFERETGRAATAEEIAGAAQAGDPDAADAIRRYVDRLARALASVVNVLDPDMVVLGGGMSNIGTLYTLLPELLPAYVFSDTVRTRIECHRHGDASGVRGAAWLWPAETEA
ncbi:ROK family protein [Parvibaculum sp.]|uniref:ROK family protein n=1 Tax=Parvibaculum sp. TaxID=2024848 RepID=UPI000C8AFB5B|nr:ROK family protein [Parvibaculum sp.]MAB13683.1 fructokinase [Parvibaculum sp.]